MTRYQTISTARIAALPALTLALATPAPAQVQDSVQDYRLPPASPSPSPTAAGPVDSDHPTTTPTRPAPDPSPPPVIELPAPVMPAAEPREAPAARAEPPRAVGAPGPVARPTTIAPVAAPSVAPTLAPSIGENAPTAPATTEPALASPEESLPWPWIAGGLAGAVLLLSGFLFWRRRTAAVEEPAYEPAPMPAAGSEPSPPAALTKPPKPQRVAPPPPATPPAPPAPLPAAPGIAQRPLEMQLEARHLSRAMVNATLAYRLTLTNHADAPAGPLRIAGDIVSAHASLSAQEQLDPGNATLATIHEIGSLAPGESATLSGELRLPIASILPIRSGSARVFVPLARFRAETADGIAATRVFVIGQASEQPGGALRPFPLDRGPGVDRAIGQRELGVLA